MKTNFKNSDPNLKQNPRTLVQKGKLPNVNKAAKESDFMKNSFSSLSSSGVIQKSDKKASYLPQINEKQNENSEAIRKLLKEKCVPLKLAPVDTFSKTKFGWVSQTTNGAFQKDKPSKKQTSPNSTFSGVSSLNNSDKGQKQSLRLEFNKDKQEKCNEIINLQSYKASHSLKNSKSQMENLYLNEFVQNSEQINLNEVFMSEIFDFTDTKSMKFVEADRQISGRKNQNDIIVHDEQFFLEAERIREEQNHCQGQSGQSSPRNEQEGVQKGRISKKQSIEIKSQQNDIIQQTSEISALEPINFDSLPQINKQKSQQQIPTSQVNIDTYSQQQLPQPPNSQLSPISPEPSKRPNHLTITQLSNKSKSSWLMSLDQLKDSFQRMNYEKAIFEKEVFIYIIETFNKFYMDKEERLYFLSILDRLVNVNAGKEFQTLNDQLKFCGEIGQKLEKLANTIHFKHKQCLKYWRFICPEDNTSKKYSILFQNLKFDLDLKQIQKLAKVVESLCVNNMDAFTFLSLYFQIAVQIKLVRQKKSFVETEGDFLSCLKRLQELYPANRASINLSSLNTTATGKEYKLGKKQSLESKALNIVQVTKEFKQKIVENYGIESIEFDKNFKFESIHFTKDSDKKNLDQLKDYIKHQATLAKADEQTFINLVKYPCIEHGYGFKSDIKIKTHDSNSIFSIMRTIEKLLSSSFKKQLEHYKNQRMQKSDEKLKNIGLKEFLEWEQYEVQMGLRQILQKQDKIEFKAKDLVRGKCKFNTIEEIQATIRLLKEKIEKKDSDQIKILQLENRLGNNTKDVVLLIKLPHSVAELQLALKQDTILNEFNHKIYELKRSKIYACVTNLFIRGRKWGQVFFRQQMQLFKEMLVANPYQMYNEQVCAKNLESAVLSFEQNVLKNFDIKASNDQLEQYSENRTVDFKINQIQRVIKSGYFYRLNKKLRVDMQKQNAVLFFLRNGNVQKAWSIVQEFSQSDLEKNPIILRLKGDILREKQEKGDQKKCIQCYQRYVRIEKSQKGMTMELANVLLLLGQIKLGNRNFTQALDYFKRCAQIKEKICKRESVDYAMVLNRIGHLYRIKGDFKSSLQFYNRALQLIELKAGKDSLNAAQIYCSLGNANYCCNNIPKSLQYYQKSLQIYKKIKGSKSMEVSIIYNNMGNFYKQRFMFQQALKYYFSCLEIKEKVKGQFSLDVAHVYNNIGILYRKMENFVLAEKYFNLCMIIRKEVKGQHSYIAAESYEHLGKFYTSKGVSKDKSPQDFELAMDYLKKAVAIKKSVLGQQSTEVANAMFNIGNLYWTIKNKKALEYYFYSLTILQKKGGKNSIDCSKVFISIAVVYHDRSKLDRQGGRIQKAKQKQKKALTYYEKGYKIQENVRGETSDLAQTFYSLSQLYAQMEVLQKAYDYADWAFEIWKKVRPDKDKYTKYAAIQRENIRVAMNKHAQSKINK